MGTLVACSHEAKLVKEDGSIENIGKMLGVDAAATIFSGFMGTSPTTSYIESATGISEGGRTGLTSLITGLLFLSALIFIPLISIVPVFATAPALIVVGIFMIRQITRIDFKEFDEAFPAVLTLILMPLTFSITTGMAFGFISWGVIKLLIGKHREINWVMYVVIALSVLSLVL